MNRKLIFVSTFTLLCATGLTGCGQPAEKTDTPVPEVQTQTNPPSPPKEVKQIPPAEMTEDATTNVAAEKTFDPAAPDFEDLITVYKDYYPDCNIAEISWERDRQSYRVKMVGYDGINKCTLKWNPVSLKIYEAESEETDDAVCFLPDAIELRKTHRFIENFLTTYDLQPEHLEECEIDCDDYSDRCTFSLEAEADGQEYEAEYDLFTDERIH
ncbi:MAG: hypothetical protein Q4P30_04330 [Eubacteriales bacterium]|nr:hypothetical protein [Eubacteriales bacterium]